MGNKKPKGFYSSMMAKIARLKKLNPKFRNINVDSVPDTSYSFKYLIDYHTPTNPLEYQRINRSDLITNAMAKVDKPLEELDINVNVKTKIIKGEISEGFKGLFRGRNNKSNINEQSKMKIDYIKDGFGDAYGPLRLKIDNRNLPILESTRAVGCFSALDSGLLGYPSL